MTDKPKCCLISGASSDIGLACQQELASVGMPVVALLNSASECQPASDQFDDFFHIDLESESSIATVMEALLGSYCVSRFISLGSINEPSYFHSIDGKSLSRHLFVNAIAPLLIAKDIVPGMVDLSFGRIVLTSSIGVKFGGSLSSIGYSMSKHASEFIPQQLRRLAKYNVFTNVVRIGVTDTRRLRMLGKNLESRRALIPANRFASPSEIAAFLAWLSSENNSFMSGQILNYSGGE